MAKISTYPLQSSPSLSDMVIGTDVANSNETKNFSISDIFALGQSSGIFVPYTGAIGNVDLGANSIDTSLGLLLSGATSSITLNGSEGTNGQVLTSGGVGATPYWTTPQGVPSGDFWRGQFYHNVTQSVPGANTATAVILSNSDISNNGISVVSDGVNLTRITVTNTGFYNINFTAFAENNGGSQQTLDIWLSKNGVLPANNIPNTNRKIQMQSNSDNIIISSNYFVYLLAGDYVNLMWAATSVNVKLSHDAATAIHPDVPSATLTINRI